MENEALQELKERAEAHEKVVRTLLKCAGQRRMLRQRARLFAKLFRDPRAVTLPNDAPAWLVQAYHQQVRLAVVEKLKEPERRLARDLEQLDVLLARYVEIDPSAAQQFLSGLRDARHAVARGICWGCHSSGRRLTAKGSEPCPVCQGKDG